MFPSIVVAIALGGWNMLPGVFQLEEYAFDVQDGTAGVFLYGARESYDVYAALDDSDNTWWLCYSRYEGDATECSECYAVGITPEGLPAIETEEWLSR